MIRRSRSRTIGYEFEGGFDETAVEKILIRAKEEGVVTQFDTGRGRVVWFNGSPGKALREVRDAVVRLIVRHRGT